MAGFRFLAAKLAAALYLGLACLGTLGGEPAQVFRVGITAFRDKSVTVREWQPTMDFLSAQIPGTRFEAVPMNLPEFEIALAKNQLDFVITNPEHYVLMEALYGVSRVATLVKSENGKLVNQFGGVIFTRSEREDVRHLEDLKGKVVASVDRTSFAAFLLQYDLLKQQGIDLDRDCKVHFLGFPQDLSVMAVLEGKADVGFVRTGVLEAMAGEGKIQLAQIKVINPANSSNFPFLRSTALFPEWPLATAPQVPMDITNRVAAALLLMPPDSPAARSARYYRWSTPVEYQSVQKLMRRHRIYPYDRSEKISPQEVFHQYSIYILLAVSATALLMAVFYLRARRLNTSLKISRRELSEMAHHDTLTGLPNRNLLDDRLAQALSQKKRSGESLAVCLMDLDGFKAVNDTWGHKVGDEVLQEVARRLQAVLREFDTVARWGGDEFVLLLDNLAEGPQLQEVMERLLAAVARPFAFCDGARVGASIGVTLYPADPGDAQGLLKHADEAMYCAKKAGGNRFCLHGKPEKDGGQPARGTSGAIIEFKPARPA